MGKQRSALLLAGGMGTILLMAAWSGVRLHAEMTELALARRESLAFLCAATLRERFDRLRDLGVSLATRVRFRERVKAGQWDEAVAIMKDVPRDLPSIDRVFLADPEGVLRADVPALPEVRGLRFADRDWYKGVSRSWEPYVSDIYRRKAEPSVNVFAVAVPIFDDARGRLGILVLQVRLDTVYEWASSVRVGDQGFVRFVDRSGRAVGRPGQEAEDASERPFIRRALSGERGVGIQDGVLVVYEPVGPYGWAVVVEQPEALAFASRRRGVLLLSAFYALLLGVNAALAWLLLRAFRQRERAEGIVRAANASLAASNAELESFSYSVSHDLRAPVRAVDGYARMLEEDCAGALPEGGRRYVSLIRRNARQMGQLIDDLLAFSRLGRKAMDVAPIDLRAMAESVWAELRAANGDRALEFRLGPLPPGRGDPALVRQVMVNLLGNAVKYSRGRAPAVIEVSGRRENGEAVYSVRDNGVGFQPEYVHKLFGVFQRLHSSKEFEGTGIGLALVHRIVTRHGGRVWAEGRPGEGAAFHFTLPEEADSPPAAAGSVGPTARA